jgi:hypothetical protein
MEWVKKIVDDHDEKEKEGNRKILEKSKSDKKIDAIQAKWESCVDNVLRPFFDELQTDLEREGHYAEINPENKADKLNFIFWFSTIKTLDPKRTHTIKFSKNNLSEFISVNVTPSGIVKDRKLTVATINKTNIEELIKEFFEKVFYKGMPGAD